jgi:hypothetical protein
MSSINCPHCGGQNDAKADFCSRCERIISSGSARERDTTPSSWVRRSDPWVGYTVAHPPRWTLRYEDGRVIVQEDATGSVQALVWPMQVPAEARAAPLDYAQKRYLEFARTIDPSIEAWTSQDPTLAPSVRLLRTRFKRGTTQLQGRVNISAVGPNVAVRSFHAPHDSPGGSDALPPRADDLLKILDSFRVVPAVARTAYHEPGEASFSALVPIDWTPHGAVTRAPSTGNQM